MVSAAMTTRPKGIVQHISAPTDKSVDTPRILYTQWLLEHVTSAVSLPHTGKDTSTVEAGAYN